MRDATSLFAQGQAVPDSSSWLVALCEPALSLGRVDVVAPVLRWLAGTDPHASWPAVAEDRVVAVAEVVAAAIDTLTARPERPCPSRSPDRLDPFVNELRLALPLLRVLTGARERDDVDALPLPSVGGDRRDLWRVSRDLVAADLTGCAVARRELTFGRTVRAYREAVVAESFLDGCSADVHPAWSLVAARLGWLTGDVEVCRVAREQLRPVREQFALLGRLLPIGPVGWFLADVEHLLGNDVEARAANELAEQVSRRAGARAWTARCRLQRARLADGRTARGTAGPAPADGPRRGGLPARTDDRAGAGAVFADRDGEADLLTPRQRSILELAAAGLTNAQIARRLFLSVATVERHCTLAYRALGVRNRAQALGLLAARGVVDIAVEGQGSVS